MKQTSVEHVAWWEKQKARGKWFYILQQSLYWFLAMTIIKHLSHWYRKGEFELDYFYIIAFFLFSFVYGLVNWLWNDSLYQTHILNNKIKDGLEQQH